MRKIIGLVLAVIFLFSWQWAISDARLLRFPNINGDLVVFVYAGDIWSVPAAGRRRPAPDLAPRAGAVSQDLPRRPLDRLFGRIFRLAPGLRHARPPAARRGS